jgi:ribose transport system permease protein
MNGAKLVLKNKIFSGFNVREWVILFALIIIVIIFSTVSDRFATLANFEVILRQVAILAVLSFGMTFVISTGGIDLSIGSTIALIGILTAFALKAKMSVLAASCIGLGIGGLIGFTNGIITAKVKIPPFLVTLGLMSVLRGTAMVITKTYPVQVFNKDFVKIWGNGYIGAIPAIVLWAAVIFAVAQVFYVYTPFGNYVRAIGGNALAAKYSGVNVDKTLVMVYVLNGMFAGFAGLMMLARMSTARSDIGTDSAMDAITATVLGGTSMFGGKGSISFTFVGALIITVLSNGLVILGVDANVQLILKGIIVILAVSFSSKK